MEDKRIRYGRLVSIAGICCNIFLAVAKLRIGLSSGMISIVADSVNNFSDSAASIISLLGFRLSSRPADSEHPYGHARYEYLSGLAVAFLVLLAGVELLKSSIEKIIHPCEIELSAVTFSVLILSIAVKAGMYFLYTKTGKEIESGTILAAAQDSKNDVFTTGGVLFSSLIMYFAHVNIDGFTGTLVAAFVLYSGVKLVNETVAPLLGTMPDENLVKQIEEKILSYDGVLGTHDLIIHDYGPGHCFASVHVEVPAEQSVLLCHEVIDRIEHEIEKEMKIQLVIHYDPIVTDESENGVFYAFIRDYVRTIDEKLSVHDVKYIHESERHKIIFDIVIPENTTLSEDEILSKIREKVKSDYPEFDIRIKVDHSYVDTEIK